MTLFIADINSVDNRWSKLITDRFNKPTSLGYEEIMRVFSSSGEKLTIVSVFRYFVSYDTDSPDAAFFQNISVTRATRERGELFFHALFKSR